MRLISSRPGRWGSLPQVGISQHRSAQGAEEWFPARAVDGQGRRILDEEIAVRGPERTSGAREEEALLFCLEVKQNNAA